MNKTYSSPKSPKFPNSVGIVPVRWFWFKRLLFQKEKKFFYMEYISKRKWCEIHTKLLNGQGNQSQLELFLQGLGSPSFYWFTMNKIEVYSKINHTILQLFHSRTPLQLDHITHGQNPNPTDLLKLKNHKKSSIFPCRRRLNLLYSISVKEKERRKKTQKEKKRDSTTIFF